MTQADKIYIFNAPEVVFTWGDTVGCYPLEVGFAVIDSTLDYPVSNIQWDFGDGKADTGYQVNNSYTISGNYTVSMQVLYENNCSYTYNRAIQMQVYPLPVADFIIDTDSLFAGELIPFIDQTTGSGLQWYWDFGDQIQSTQQNPYHIYTHIGEYDVKLTVVSVGDCSDSITKTIKITEGLIIPNVFTPNGDGDNDVFRIPISGYKDYQLLIFNRWGEVLFESKTKNAPWDGRTPTGAMAAEGTYFYVLKVTTAAGIPQEYKGYIMLLR